MKPFPLLPDDPPYRVDWFKVATYITITLGICAFWALVIAGCWVFVRLFD